MNMNEKQYDHPERFDPERYLGPTPALESPVFGFGRRACLGVHYSLAAIFITVSSVLSVFDLRAQDKDGKDVEIEPAFTGGMYGPPPYLVLLSLSIEFLTFYLPNLFLSFSLTLVDVLTVLSTPRSTGFVRYGRNALSRIR